jgi:7-cyano-7-deazaguanine tRNA-ribosyltransferase
MTDSGGYQILVYGDVSVTPKEIVRYQECIGSDIATVLDVPTGWKVSKKFAQQTVDETLRRARELLNYKKRDDIAWVGPIQGGRYLDLVAQSAKETGKLPFQIHALGSPTPVMEQYRFHTLVDMVLNAKINLPQERPFHLFGCGHPFIFGLAVALGCDLFDSAAYVLYAREGRYMTNFGTLKLNELRYFPCSCPICSKNEPKDIAEIPQKERQEMLAQHNLYVSFSEIKRIKQAIMEGRLWEHLEMQAHSHPALLQAIKRLKKYSEYLEMHSPVTKKRGLFFFSSLGIIRPEVTRHRKRLFERYSPKEAGKILVLLPQTRMKPFHRSREQRRVLNSIQKHFEERTSNIHVCTFAAPFGVVPIELDEIYPLSQYVIARPFDLETIEYVAKQVAEYIIKADYKAVILLQDFKEWKGKMADACRIACENKEIPLALIKSENTWSKQSLIGLNNAIREALEKETK